MNELWVVCTYYAYVRFLINQLGLLCPMISHGTDEIVYTLVWYTAATFIGTANDRQM